MGLFLRLLKKRPAFPWQALPLATLACILVLRIIRYSENILV